MNLRSVRARITLGVTVVAAAAFALIAVLAPGVVADVLEDDLIQTEAEAALESSLFASDVTSGNDGLITDLDGNPIDIFGPGSIGATVLDSLDLPFGDLFDAETLDDEALAEIAAGQVDVLRSVDGLEPLLEAAGGPFAIEIEAGEFAVVADDASFDIERADVDELDVPVMTDLEFSEYLFDDLGIFPAGDTLIESGGAGRVIAGSTEVDGVELLVTADAEPVDRSVDQIRMALWLAVPLITAAVAAIGWWLTGRSLRPVRSITEQAATISGGSLDARVPVPDSGDEIAMLAVTVNEMLARLETDDRARRRFISDASHELRSPVAVMRNEAEVALHHPDRSDVGDLAVAVADESRRMSAIIDDLLALARHDEGVASPTTDIDLDDVVLEEAARTRRVPVDTGQVSAGRVRGREDELARMVGHLLDNAARHAISTVAVSLVTSGDQVRLGVDDDGPGIPGTERDRVFERFVRLDEARTRDRGGAGLGLAVVHSIVHRAGGDVEVTDSHLGGARFTVTFPA